MSDLGLKRGFVVAAGTERRNLGRGKEMLPWETIAAGRIGLCAGLAVGTRCPDL
jgi:hypothetical protein